MYTATTLLSTKEQYGFDHSVAEFEKSYPENPKLLIKRRLEDFLVLAENIPFDAKLKKNAKGFLVFEDPQLERKSKDYKKCFRAGPQAVNSARKFAQNWLKELN